MTNSTSVNVVARGTLRRVGSPSGPPRELHDLLRDFDETARSRRVLAIESCWAEASLAVRSHGSGGRSFDRAPSGVALQGLAAWAARSGPGRRAWVSAAAFA